MARDRTGFWQAYGPDTIPAGVFDGNLAGQGETLQLIRPGGSSAEDVTVAEVAMARSRRGRSRPPAAVSHCSCVIRCKIRTGSAIGLAAHRRRKPNGNS